MQFYRCEGCGNLVTFLSDKTACTPRCCGQPMTELVAGTTDAAREKHVPEVSVEGSVVTAKVGSVTHPMVDKHFIQFIIAETDKGFHKRDLNPGDAPEAQFTLAEDERPVAVYEYCNLHGLWKAEL